ncbi:MAG: alpha/beta fold hydrolase [Steroidobacteraceae bacterium]
MNTLAVAALSGFVPPQWFTNPHVQSILPTLRIRRRAVMQRAAALVRQGEPQTLDCGNGVRLLGHLATQASVGRPRARALLVVRPAWEGNADSLYVLSLGGYLFARGCDVFRLNLRDHGPTHHLNEGVFHSCLLDEVIGAVAAVQRRFEPERLSVAGFSLGGNFALRVAADGPQHGLRLERALGICPVLRPRSTVDVLDRTFIYREYFLHAWKRSLQRKQALFPKRYRFEHVLAQNTIARMTELMLEHYSEFESLDHYLDGYALTGDRLAGLTVPAHMLIALDDPIIPARDLSLIARSPLLDLIRSPIGGHCGFMDSWHRESWADRQVARLLGVAT